jgi:osmotically-inducible protein OsmY
MKTAEVLQQDVVDELAWDPKVDSSTIGVTSSDGVVTLRGRVKSYTEKRAAEMAAKRVRGVHAVANDLEVVPLPKFERDDTTIAQAALNALKWAYSVPDEKLKVTVEKGWLTLEGQVEWQHQKQAAENAVRDLTGVRGVSNLITIKTTVSTREVKAKIEAAFKRSAEIDADHVRVEAKNGKVTLRGTVGSWAEKEAAETAAWAAPGVGGVSNLISVEATAPVF